MTVLGLSKKAFLAIAAGFAVTILIGAVTGAISFFVIIRLGFTFNWLSKITPYLSLITGGFVAGWIAKEKGLIYGGILGIILKLMSISIVGLTFFLPTSLIYGPNFPAGYGQELAQKNIVNQLLSSPITIVLTAFGGYLGEYFSKRHLKKN